MARRARSIWERLAMESMEGPAVTISLPREVAQELVGVLMGSLEMMDADGGDDMEPDGDDDIDGMPDGEDAGSDPLAALVGDDGEGGESEPDFDGPADDDSDPDNDDSDDDDEPDEAMDYRHSGGNASGMRTGTALGERRRRR